LVSGGLASPAVPANDTGVGVLSSRGTVHLIQTTISRNSADSGGGQGGRLETFRVTLDRNTATGNGGALFNNTDGRSVLQRTLVQLNSAANGGGIFNSGVTSRVSIITNLAGNHTPNNCAPAGSVTGCTG
jgi:hypothetical protein